VAKLDDQQITGAAAIILAGGRSSRMGRPKALVMFDGEPLIAHLVRTLGGIFDKVVIVAAPDQDLPDLPASLVRDELPFQGPVGGIYYGLRAAGEGACFVTSCDAPFLNVSLIKFLTAQIPGYDVVVPYWEGRFQPLQAVYRASVVPFLSDQLEKGELRPVTLFQRVRTLKINEDEIRRFDPEGLSFHNMNTPEDYETALTRWERNKRSTRFEMA
jgi:molybdopterin-guanine dinucleotide biosynthesis protein A